MLKEELKIWFINKLNSCYLVKHDKYDNSILMVYDKNYNRERKLGRILGKEISEPNFDEGVVLFKQDWDNDYLWCNYGEIWSFFEANYSNNYMKIKELISDILKDTTKCEVLTPCNNMSYFH